MSSRVRVLQSLVLGLIGLSLILYTSLVYSPSQLYRIEHSNHESANSSAMKWSNRSESLDSKQLPTDGNNTGTATALNSNNGGGGGSGSSSSSSSSSTIINHSASGGAAANTLSSSASTKKLPPSPPVSKTSLVLLNVQKGVLTKDVYDAGHTIANADLCPDLGRAMKLLILITSSPEHAESRMAIRQTWGHFSQRRDIGLAFVVGLAKQDKHNAQVRDEFDMYRDLIQARFVDSYDNLTLKTVSMFEWVDNYCSEVPFVLKTDDDMFVNVPKLLALAQKQVGARRKIFGRLAKKWKPVRSSNSKYFVSVGEFARPHFPDFTTGPAYLVTRDAIHDLYSAALNATFLKLEDVFMTGVVAQNTSVKRVHVNEFYNKRIPFNVCNVRKAISIHMVKFYEQFVLWEKLHDTRVRCK